MNITFFWYINRGYKLIKNKKKKKKSYLSYYVPLGKWLQKKKLWREKTSK